MVPTDYVAKSLAGQTIPSGATSKTFVVTVNSDTLVEPNETSLFNGQLSAQTKLSRTANPVAGKSQNSPSTPAVRASRNSSCTLS